MNVATRAVLTVFAILAIVPSAAAQDTQGTHSVRSGDTLWDLAARYLADPFRWPELYDLNSSLIEDPHWIFPGEKLRIPGAPDLLAGAAGESPDSRALRADRAASVNAAGQEKPGSGERAGARRSFGPAGQYPEESVFRSDPSAPSYGELSIEQREASAVVSSSDFYGAPALADQQAFASAGVTSRVVAETHPDLKLPVAARLNDEVVLQVSDGSLEEGDYLKAVQWGRRVGSQSTVLNTVSVVRVTRTYPTRDSVRAEVVRIFGDYRVGDAMVRAAEYPLTPGARSEPDDDGPVGTVLAFAVDHRLLGLGEELFMDIGDADGVRVGDLFAIFPATVTAAETAPWEDRLTTVRVVHTSSATATARVTEVRDAGMRPGAPVRRVERMPD